GRWSTAVRLLAASRAWQGRRLLPCGCCSMAYPAAGTGMRGCPMPVSARVCLGTEDGAPRGVDRGLGPVCCLGAPVHPWGGEVCCRGGQGRPWGAGCCGVHA